MRKINRPTCPNPAALATNYKHPDNKAVLITSSHGKCMYCESKVNHISYGDVEHIRPKSRYAHLEFDWSNLGYVCSKCNTTKHDKFEEDTPYVNPYDEDPEDHLIAVGALLKHKAGSERGQITVIDIGLNRASLLEKRQEWLDKIEKCIDACTRTSNSRLKKLGIEALLLESNEDKEFSLFVKSLLKQHGLL